MPTNKDADELSLKIQETAQVLFDKLGIEEVSMHRIAQEIGIGQGTLYRRYPNKNSLCFSLMEQKFERFAAEIEDYLHRSAELTVMERLSTVMTRMILRLDEDLEVFKTLFNSDRLEEAKDNVFELPLCMFFRDKVKGLLLEAVEQKELVTLDPDFAALIIVSTLRPELIFYLHDLGYDSQQIAEKYCQSSIEPLFVKK